MPYLEGLKEYCWDHYRKSIFKSLSKSTETWVFHLHGNRVIRAKVLANEKYEVRFEVEGEGEEAQLGRFE